LGDDAEQHDTLLLQAKTCMREGKPLRAAALYSQLIKRNPTDAGTYINRGSAHAAAGDVGAAISDFSVAIRLDRDLVQAWYNRGMCSPILEASRALSPIRLKPDFAFAYCNRVLANSELAHYDDAIADYSVGIERNPREPYCRFNRGNLYLTLGYYQKAVDDFCEALTAKPNDSTALTKRGQAYELLGQTSQALNDFRAALDSHPDLQAAKEGLARIVAQQKQTDDESGKPLKNP
jgi:tetratricopeptide (TPR) repeat protein